MYHTYFRYGWWWWSQCWSTILWWRMAFSRAMFMISSNRGATCWAVWWDVGMNAEGNMSSETEHNRMTCVCTCVWSNWSSICVCVCVCMSVVLPCICVCVCVCTHACLWYYWIPICQYIYPVVGLPVCLVCLLLFIYLSIYLAIYLSICVCLSIYLSVHPSLPAWPYPWQTFDMSQRGDNLVVCVFVMESWTAAHYFLHSLNL